VGRVIYVLKSHSFSFSCGLEYGTNNMVDVKAVLVVVEIAVQRGIPKCVNLWGFSADCEMIYRIEQEPQSELQASY